MATDADSTPVPADQHPIDLLGLSRRAEGALRRAGIHTIEALAHLSDADLLYIADVGPGALAQIRSGLARWPEQVRAAALEIAGEATLAETLELPASVGGDDTDIRALSLHASMRGRLAHAGVATVGALAGLTPRQALAVPRIGEVGLEHIRGHLARYARLQAALAAPDRSEAPVVAAGLLDEVAAVDLDGMPLARLKLPRREERPLLLAGVSTVGALARLPLDVVGPYPAAVESVNRYLRWLARGGAPGQRPEASRPGVAALPGNLNLEQVVAEWLARLPENRRLGARLRYGFDGEPLLGCEVAAVLGVSEVRVSQLLKTSRKLFRWQPLRGAVRPHLDGLHGFVADRGGLVSFDEIEAELPAALNLGGVQALAACTLLTAIEPGFAWSRALRLLGDEFKPLRQVRTIRAAARHLAWLNGRSMPLADVLADLRGRDFYPQGAPEARDAFFLACMRTDPRAGVAGDTMRLPPPPSRRRAQGA